VVGRLGLRRRNRALQVVQDREKFEQEAFRGELEEIRFLARHALLIVVKLRLQPDQPILEAFHLLHFGGQRRVLRGRPDRCVRSIAGWWRDYRFGIGFHGSL